MSADRERGSSERARLRAERAERLLAVHDALREARLPHAIGGAIALGYCTGEPRETRDLDINVFVSSPRFREVAEALPDGVGVTASDIAIAERDGQVRLAWDDMPIDVFLNSLPFHEEVRKSVREVELMGRTIPVVGCVSLAVFKAILDRAQHWADIEAMVAKGAIDLEQVIRWVAEMTGPRSQQAQRLEQLRAA